MEIQAITKAITQAAQAAQTAQPTVSTQTTAKTDPKLAKLKKACQDLEAVFLKDLLTIMRRSIPKSKTEKAPGADIYQDMFDQAIADSASKQGSFGIGDMLYKKMAPAIERQMPKIIAQIKNAENKILSDKNSDDKKIDIRG